MTKKILIVDDQMVNRMLIEELLEMMNGCSNYISVENGEDAIDMYMKHIDEIKLVLMDVMMPGIGGVEATRRLNKINPELPVVIVSAMRNDELKKSLGDINVKMIMGKPIDRNKLEYLCKTYIQ